MVLSGRRPRPTATIFQSPARSALFPSCSHQGESRVTVPSLATAGRRGAAWWPRRVGGLLTVAGPRALTFDPRRVDYQPAGRRYSPGPSERDPRGYLLLIPPGNGVGPMQRLALMAALAVTAARGAEPLEFQVRL